MSSAPTDLAVMRALRRTVACHLDGELADRQQSAYSAAGCEVPEGEVDGLDADLRAGLSMLLEIKAIRPDALRGRGSVDDPWRRWLERWDERRQEHRETLRRMLGDVPAARRPAARAPIRRDRVLAVLAGFAFDGQLAYELGAALVDWVPQSEVVALRMMCADDRRYARFFRDMCAEAFELAPDTTARAVAVALQRYLELRVTSRGRSDVGLLEGVPRDEHWHHQRIVLPVLGQWRVLERNDLGSAGARARVTVAGLVEGFDEKLRAERAAVEARRDREALRREREVAFLARMGIVPEMAL
ncbi:hypothetical protein G4X40_07685 [Rhodococcus sp. D2-41]|uniref:hypothetical protein n=1 Tax=Speluncibacter jeojiensis TaxID=2710754 RepID=UPI00240FC861|nr:hypothetical protein [Rhodococcus sp. D2-41]MDG3010028.1 hypothetical protein [Rhodococcus sp. D2-41]